MPRTTQRSHRSKPLLGLSVGLLAATAAWLSGMQVPAAGQGSAPGQSSTPGQAAPAGPPQYLPISEQWCLSRPRRCIELEVARSQQQQIFGLQRRPRLAPLRGMWFPYSTPTPVRFWMHLTPEPLDMIFVREGRVQAIETMVKPCMQLPCPSYGPGVPVDGVIELAGGEAARLGIRAGTAVAITPLNRPRAAADQ